MQLAHSQPHYRKFQGVSLVQTPLPSRLINSPEHHRNAKSSFEHMWTLNSCPRQIPTQFGKAWTQSFSKFQPRERHAVQGDPKVSIAVAICMAVIVLLFPSKDWTRDWGALRIVCETINVTVNSAWPRCLPCLFASRDTARIAGQRRGTRDWNAKYQQPRGALDSFDITRCTNIETGM